MPSECLPFTRIPHTTPLFRDYLYHFDRVSQFYPRPAQVGSWLSDEALRITYDNDRRRQVASILERQNRAFGASAKAIESIDRLRRGACAAVTGQQVGFLGGPLFSILKALTAVRLAAEATDAGVDCVPIFWLATEDHDFAEIQNALVQDTNGQLHTVSASAEFAPGAPMSEVRLTAAITTEVERITHLLGDGETADFIRQAYRPGETIGDAFASLFAKVFAEFGVILLDASDPELHELAKPIYREAIVESAGLDAALLERGKVLVSAGYHEQVKVTPSSTLLFGTVHGARTPIHRSNGQFVMGEEKLSEPSLLARISEHPEQFTPNVLLRPIVQDFLLPTLCYSGGPAEVAYFAQAAVVYARLLGRVTPIVPRFSATLVDARSQRFMQRYGMTFSDILAGPEHVREMMAARSLPAELQTAFQHADDAINDALNGILSPLKTLDPTLLGAAERAGNKMRYQLDRLRKRAANAELRRSEIVARQSDHLNNTLFPHKDLQERVISGVSFLARYGMPVLDTVYDAVKTGCPEHQIIYL